jgi:hypothetical protein
VKTSQINIAVLTLLMFLIQSCLSTARLSDYPRSSEGYDFNKIANSKRTDKDKGWNSKTGFEYYLKTETVHDTTLIRAIIQSLREENYVIKHIDVEKGTILAKRGLEANEWKSVIAVYFQKNNAEIDLYVNCKISQDITGGWADNRAEKVGKGICLRLGSCKQSYPVRTSS